MRLLYWGVFLIIFGLFLFALSVYEGEGGFALFLIFPIFYSTGVIGLIAMLFIFIGFFLIFLSPFHEISEDIHQHDFGVENYEPLPVKIKKEKHYGGVILIGPIPIIFGSDRNMVVISILVTLLILVAIAVILIIVS